MCLFAMTIPARGQKMSDGPITKDNLFSALESMQARKSKRKNAAWYVALIRAHKVDFHLTPDDELEIRHKGRYLGQKGLDSLITAVRDNHVVTSNQQPSSDQEKGKAMSDEKSKSQESPRSISQSITNSPGSAAIIGDNNTINLGPQPRRITVGQAEKIILVLRAHPAQTITVFRITSDREAETFALQIAQVLHDGGWQVDVEGIGILMPPTYGVECRIKDPEQAAIICPLLQEAFGRAGIKITPNPDGVFSEYPTAILVGLRP